MNKCEKLKENVSMEQGEKMKEKQERGGRN
jgi:hypothetical protein